MKRTFTTIACLLLLITGSSAWGQPAQVSTLALQETLNANGGMVMGPDGLLYVSNFTRDAFSFGIADYGNKIYKVNPVDGSVELFVESSSFRGPFSIALDHDGNLLVTSVGFGVVSSVTPEGVVSSFAEPGGLVTGVAVAPDSSVFVAKCQPTADRGLFKYLPNATEPVVFSLAECALGLTFDDDGNLYTSSQSGGVIRKYSPDGDDLGEVASLASANSFLNHLTYSRIDSVLYVTATEDNTIWKVSLRDSSVNVLAGTGEPGTADGPAHLASFNQPNGLVLSVTGDTLYVNQTLQDTPVNPNSIRMITGVLGASPVADEDEAEVPEGFTLAQNYPNPFNPATRIGFRLPQAQHVTLTVYDLMGRPVATLVEGFKPAGPHEAVFDARALPSGVYVYRLEAERFSRSKVMMLLK